jgi:hypothetical protein
MLRWRPMVPDDFDVCDNIVAVSEYQRLVTVIAARRLIGVTLLEDGRPIAVIAGRVFADRSLRLFAFLSPIALRRHARVLARGLKRRVEKLKRVLRMLEIWADPAQPRALLLATFLGFDFVEEFADVDRPGRMIWRMQWTR